MICMVHRLIFSLYVFFFEERSQLVGLKLKFPIFYAILVSNYTPKPFSVIGVKKAKRNISEAKGKMTLIKTFAEIFCLSLSF